MFRPCRAGLRLALRILTVSTAHDRDRNHLLRRGLTKSRVEQSYNEADVTADRAKQPE